MKNLSKYKKYKKIIELLKNLFYLNYYQYTLYHYYYYYDFITTSMLLFFPTPTLPNAAVISIIVNNDSMD